MDHRQLLQTLPSGDKHGPRRSAGLNLMQHEAEQLRTYIDDLETSLATNRQLLHDVITQNIRSIAGTGETAEDSVNSTQLIQELLLRNKALEEGLKQGIKERNEAQGRALINEQIATEYQQKEQEVSQEYEDLLHELDYQIDKRDKIYAELELKAESLNREVELIRKSRDVTVVSLSDHTLKMHNFIEKIRSKVQTAGRELHRARERKEQLQELCKQLYADLSKANASVRNPINRRAGSEWGHDVSRRDFSFDSGFRREESSDEEDSSGISDHVVLPEKVHIQTQSKFALPALDMNKLKQERRRSLQEESFKRPKRTKKEEKLEEEVDRLTLKAEDLNKRLEEMTLELLELNSANDRIAQENAKMTEEIEEAQQTIQTLEKSSNKPRIDPRMRGSTLIKQHRENEPVAVLRLKRAVDTAVPPMPNTTKVNHENSSGSMEIVVRSESFYGEDEAEDSVVQH